MNNIENIEEFLEEMLDKLKEVGKGILLIEVKKKKCN